MAGNRLLHLSSNSENPFYFNVLKSNGWQVDCAADLGTALKLLEGERVNMGVLRLEQNTLMSSKALNIFMDAAVDIPWIAVVDSEIRRDLADVAYNRCEDLLVSSNDEAATTFALGQTIARVLAKDNHADLLLDLRAARNIAEKQAIEVALNHFPNNMTKAAAQLGISRMTLYRLLHKHGLAEEHTRSA